METSGRGPGGVGRPAPNKPPIFDRRVKTDGDLRSRPGRGLETRARTSRRSTFDGSLRLTARKWRSIRGGDSKARPLVESGRFLSVHFCGVRDRCGRTLRGRTGVQGWGSPSEPRSGEPWSPRGRRERVRRRVRRLSGDSGFVERVWIHSPVEATVSRPRSRVLSPPFGSCPHCARRIGRYAFGTYGLFRPFRARRRVFDAVPQGVASEPGRCPGLICGCPVRGGGRTAQHQN